LQPAQAHLSASDISEIGRWLQGRIKTMVGISARVKVLPPNSVERSLGKSRRVIDQRPKV
jgi:phenylacetate-CoA ligase